MRTTYKAEVHFNVNVVACWEFNHGEWEQTQNA